MARPLSAATRVCSVRPPPDESASIGLDYAPATFLCSFCECLCVSDDLPPIPLFGVVAAEHVPHPCTWYQASGISHVIPAHFAVDNATSIKLRVFIHIPYLALNVYIPGTSKYISIQCALRRDGSCNSIRRCGRA